MDLPIFWANFTEPWDGELDAYLTEMGQKPYLWVLKQSVQMKWDLIHQLVAEHPELVDRLKEKVDVSLARGRGDTVVPNRFNRELGDQLGISWDQVKVIRRARHQTPLGDPEELKAFVLGDK